MLPLIPGVPDLPKNSITFGKGRRVGGGEMNQSILFSLEISSLVVMLLRHVTDFYVSVAML